MFNRRIFCFFIIIYYTTFSLPAIETEIDTLWTKTFGGPKSDKAYCVEITKDNGYIILGTTESFGNGQTDIYIVKTDSNGTLEWEKTVGGPEDDFAYSIIEAHDGGYVIGGIKKASGYCEYNIYIIKIDSLGNEIWSKIHCKEYRYVDIRSLIKTLDGNYILAGKNSDRKHNSSFYLVKIDKLGDIIWEKIFHDKESSQAYSICQAKDSSYLLTGFTYSKGSRIKVLKTDEQRKIIKEEIFGDFMKKTGCAIEETSDEGFIIAGTKDRPGISFSKYGTDGFYVIKLNKDLYGQWSKEYKEGTAAYSIKQTNDNGYVIAGSGRSYRDDDYYNKKDVLIIKIDSAGNELFVKKYGGKGADVAKSIKITHNEGYIIAGHTNSYGNGKEDFYLLKLYPERPLKPRYHLYILLILACALFIYLRRSKTIKSRRSRLKNLSDLEEM